MKKQRIKAPLPTHSVPSTKGVIARATLVFLEHGARAAYEFLGGSLRANELLPKVWVRAKYLERRTKE